MAFKLSDWVKWRLKNKRNVFIVLTGEGQIGKTSMAIELCRHTFNDFNLDSIAFSSEKFLELLKNRPDSAILLEDAGVSWGSHNWKSRTNQSISYATQTCGLNHQLIVLTTPSIHMLDSNARRLIQLRIKVINRGFGIPSVVKENEWTKRLIFAPLRMELNGHSVRISSYRTERPPEEMFVEFERRKKAYLDGFYSGLIRDVKVKNIDETRIAHEALIMEGSIRKAAKRCGMSKDKVSRLNKLWEIENK